MGTVTLASALNHPSALRVRAIVGERSPAFAHSAIRARKAHLREIRRTGRTKQCVLRSPAQVDRRLGSPPLSKTIGASSCILSVVFTRLIELAQIVRLRFKTSVGTETCPSRNVLSTSMFLLRAAP